MASRSQTPGGVTASASRTKTRKSAVQPDDPAAPATTIPEDMRRQWVAEAAYFIAERRGFGEGSSEDDWLQAELDIDRMLASPRH
ncbi:MAG: DUF2934 domain-containing protein [Rhodocyclaceae bacterium]|jgi:hypothetical protein|nr:MAG: DUF2934 domain-containing protein [Rhodocyclaceae bacterium]